MDSKKNADCHDRVMAYTTMRTSDTDVHISSVDNNNEPVTAQPGADGDTKVGTGEQETPSVTLIKLKTFIRQNLQKRSDSENSGNSSEESQDLQKHGQCAGSMNDGVLTPEPTPLTTSNVTLHDKIWCKGSPEPSREDTPLSPPLKFLTVPSTEKVWRARHNLVDTLSDTESDQSFSSQDTMIMMTTDESNRNQMRITESQTRYMMLKQACGRDNEASAATARDFRNAAAARDGQSAAKAHGGQSAAPLSDGLSATAVRRRRLSKATRLSDGMTSSEPDQQVMSQGSRDTLPSAVEMLQSYREEQRNANWHESNSADLRDQNDFRPGRRSSIVRQNATIQEQEVYAPALEPANVDNGQRPEHVEAVLPANAFLNDVVGRADAMIDAAVNHVLAEGDNEAGDGGELGGNDEHSDDGYESTDTANSAETNSSSSSSNTNYDSPPPAGPSVNRAQIANANLDIMEPERPSNCTRDHDDTKNTLENDVRPVPPRASHTAHSTIQAAVRRGGPGNQRRVEQNSLEERLKQLTIMENDPETPTVHERDDVREDLRQSYWNMNKNGSPSNPMVIHQHEHKTLFEREQVQYEPDDIDVGKREGKEPTVQQDLFISPEYYVQHILERQTFHPDGLGPDMDKCENSVGGSSEYRENIYRETTNTHKDKSKKHKNLNTWSREPYTEEHQCYTDITYHASYQAQPRALEGVHLDRNESVRDTRQTRDEPGGNYVHAEKVYAVLKRQGVLQVGVTTARVMELGDQQSPRIPSPKQMPIAQQNSRVVEPMFSQKVTETNPQGTQVTGQTLHETDQLYSKQQSKQYLTDFHQSQNERYGRSIQLVSAAENTSTANKTMQQPMTFPPANKVSNAEKNRNEQGNSMPAIRNNSRPRFGTTAELCQMMRAQLKQPTPASCQYPRTQPQEHDTPASYQYPMARPRQHDTPASYQYPMAQPRQHDTPASYQYPTTPLRQYDAGPSIQYPSAQPKQQDAAASYQYRTAQPGQYDAGEWPKQFDDTATYQYFTGKHRQPDAPALYQYPAAQPRQPDAPALYQYPVAQENQSPGYFSRPVNQNTESRQNQELKQTNRPKSISERESGKYFQFCISQRSPSNFATNNQEGEDTHTIYGKYSPIDRHRDDERNVNYLVQPDTSRNCNQANINISDSKFQSSNPTFSREDYQTEKYSSKPPKSQYV